MEAWNHFLASGRAGSEACAGEEACHPSVLPGNQLVLALFVPLIVLLEY